MKSNLKTDIGVLTSISEASLTRLEDRCEDCICHSIYETLKSGEDITEIDIGLGMLYIKFVDGTIRYKFIPSEKLEEKVCNTVTSRQSPLVKRAEVRLKNSIENAYKELL